MNLERDLSEALAEEYESALHAFLLLEDEEGLSRAYELGRQAISQGRGVIDLASIHTTAWTSVSPDAEEAHRAWQFFAAALAPFEMALRGFREANQALKKAADTLERRVQERTHELRRTEEQLRQSQKMDAIGRLAGGVAHDFNNILSVIISLSAVVQEDLPPNSPLRNDLQEINKAGVRGAALTKQLLMFSRQQILEPAIVDLDEVLTGMDTMLQRLIGADVGLVTLKNRRLGRVRADGGSIEQVIMNLVVNARDAMPKGGTLTIETTNLVVNEHLAEEHPELRLGPYVMLSVTDTGTGMDKATQGRVFEPFFTTKEKGKGTGLGLSTVFGIVRQSGGAIWVESEPGRGTTFRICLPRVEGVDAPQLPPPNIETLGGSETILLVEDDEQVRSVASGILRRLGYRVIEAQNPGEAILHAEREHEHIDLLLTDVVMPQMSGVELARRLGEELPDLKIICMSGYTDDSAVKHGVLEANVAYLQKPITPEALARKLRAVLDSSTAELPT
jgi:signal transduction histidine kinase/ActR/RegA family two-component response regulator